MPKAENLRDADWIDKLDPPTMKAFNALKKSKKLQEVVRNEINTEATRAIRRIMKQNGHPLTAPEAVDLTNALMVMRWILDTYEPVPAPKMEKKQK